MPTTAKVVADSISEAGQRITTMVLEYPRIIHSEFMTHRDKSRNASSSRAIPVEDQIIRIEKDPFVPSYWGKNKRGMQADEEITPENSKVATTMWVMAMHTVIAIVKVLVFLGVHKQLANRLLEPWSHIQVVVTATEWDNFFTQRLDKNAQPEIQELARVMKEAMEASSPKVLKVGEWHLPFITEEDIKVVEEVYSDEPLETLKFLSYKKLIKISVARCARVSYGLNERGWGDIDKDLSLYHTLLTNGHWSPFEHQGMIPHYPNGKSNDSTYWEKGITHMTRDKSFWSGNFKGIIQNRQLIQQS